MSLQVLFSWPICAKSQDQVPQQLLRRPKMKFEGFCFYFEFKTTLVPTCYLLVSVCFWVVVLILLEIQQLSAALRQECSS